MPTRAAVGFTGPQAGGLTLRGRKHPRAGPRVLLGHGQGGGQGRALGRGEAGARARGAGVGLRQVLGRAGQGAAPWSRGGLARAHRAAEARYPSRCSHGPASARRAQFANSSDARAGVLAHCNFCEPPKSEANAEVPP